MLGNLASTNYLKEDSACPSSAIRLFSAYPNLLLRPSFSRCGRMRLNTCSPARDPCKPPHIYSTHTLHQRAFSAPAGLADGQHGRAGRCRSQRRQAAQQLCKPRCHQRQALLVAASYLTPAIAVPRKILQASFAAAEVLAQIPLWSGATTHNGHVLPATAMTMLSSHLHSGGSVLPLSSAGRASFGPPHSLESNAAISKHSADRPVAGFTEAHRRSRPRLRQSTRPQLRPACCTNRSTSSSSRNSSGS